MGAAGGHENRTVRSCRNLARALQCGKIDFRHYAYSITLYIVGDKDCEIADCAETIPPDFVERYKSYLDDYLLPVDFMPCPRAFIAGAGTEKRLEETKRALRPRYVEIYNYIKSGKRGQML
jgi:hypothetical protein